MSCSKQKRFSSFSFRRSVALNWSHENPKDIKHFFRCGQKICRPPLATDTKLILRDIKSAHTMCVCFQEQSRAYLFFSRSTYSIFAKHSNYPNEQMLRLHEERDSAQINGTFCNRQFWLARSLATLGGEKRDRNLQWERIARIFISLTKNNRDCFYFFSFELCVLWFDDRYVVREHSMNGVYSSNAHKSQLDDLSPSPTYSSCLDCFSGLRTWKSQWVEFSMNGPRPWNTFEVNENKKATII